jgi:hypothetical protein
VPEKEIVADSKIACICIYWHFKYVPTKFYGGTSENARKRFSGTFLDASNRNADTSVDVRIRFGSTFLDASNRNAGTFTDARNIFSGIFGKVPAKVFYDISKCSTFFYALKNLCRHF